MNFPRIFQAHQRLIFASALLLMMVVCALLYLPGLSGEFIFDDSLNIVINRQVHMQNLSWEEIRDALSSGIASDVGRPLSMLSFALNHLATGLNPGYFKLTNLVIHLLVALALYFLTCQLLSLRAEQGQIFRVHYKVVAVMITAAWAVHPLQVSTVLYIVQRMTQLGALFSILALITYCHLRRRPVLSKGQILLSHAAIGLLIIIGVLCKENAALTVLYIAAIEFCLLRDRPRSRQQSQFVNSFLASFVIAPTIAALAFMLLRPEYIMESYVTRDFTLPERLLTQCRVLWDYIGWILIPDTREFVLYHENYQISRGLLDPPSTLIAMFGIAGLVAAIPLLRKRLPLISFGIAFFLCGHVLEGTVVALELVFEHRNYLPSFGLLFALFASLFSTRFALLGPKFAGAFSALVFLLFVDSTYGETKKWSSTPAHILGMYRYAPDSRRINYSMASLYSRLGAVTENATYTREALKYYRRMTELSPDSVIPFAAYLRTASTLGDPPDPQIRERFIANLRVSRFVVGDTLELLSLVNCFYAGDCEKLGPLIPDVYRAIGENAVVTAAAKQRTLDEIALSLLLQHQHVADAVGLYYFAESLSPQLSLIDIKLIMLELGRSQPEAARAHLEKSRNKTNTDPDLTEALDDLREDIDEYPAVEQSPRQ